MTIKPKLFTNNSANIKDLNSLYQFYKSIWQKTFTELGSQKSTLEMDFQRFDIKVGLFDGDNPVAFHGYQFFDLRKESDREHPYFSQVSAPLIQELNKLGVYKLATAEYMCVCPDYSKNTNRKIGAILGGFTTNYFKNSNVDGLITITRNGRGVNRMCKMYGAEPLYEDLKLHNVEVDVMLFRPEKIKPNPVVDIQNLIENLTSEVVDSKSHELRIVA